VVLAGRELIKEKAVMGCKTFLDADARLKWFEEYIALPEP
jgi:hypothetical protein